MIFVSLPSFHALYVETGNHVLSDWLVPLSFKLLNKNYKNNLSYITSLGNTYQQVVGRVNCRILQNIDLAYTDPSTTKVKIEEVGKDNKQKKNKICCYSYQFPSEISLHNRKCQILISSKGKIEKIIQTEN